MTEEHRRHVRWKKKLKVSYALTEEMEFYDDIFTEDISEEGLQIYIPDSIELGQIVRLKLEFANDSVPISITGKVVFLKEDQKKFRIGFSFVDLNDFVKQRIKRNLEEVQFDLENEE